MMAKNLLKSPVSSSPATQKTQAMSAQATAHHEAHLQNLGYLVDTVLTPSRLQQGLYTGAGLLVIALMGSSGLALWARLVVIMLFIGLTFYWLKVQPLHSISAIWQGDSRTWYWQPVVQGTLQRQRATGELAYCRNLGWVIQLGFKSSGHRQPKNLSILVWRDQVSQEQWRRLMVISRLRQSSSTLLG